MRKQSLPVPGKYGFGDLTWDRKVLWPDLFELSGILGRPRSLRAADAAYGEIRAEDGRIFLSMFSGKGKISDSGYDQITAFYTSLPAEREVIFRAAVRVHAFLTHESPTGQEGFGLFFRDTMENDRLTGYPYSDMAAAGGLLCGLNFFVRSGITKQDTQSVRNTFARPRTAPDPLPEGTPLLLITLVKRGSRILGEIRTEDGRKVFERTELTADGPLFRTARETGVVYAGFFAADGAAIEILEDSVSVEIGEIVREEEKKTFFPQVKENDPRTADKTTLQGGPRSGCSAEEESGHDAPEEEIAFIEPPAERRLFAAPDGMAGASGTREDPADIVSAVRAAAGGGTAILLPGRYHCRETIELGGKAYQPKCLFAEGGAGETVLDFGGVDAGILLSGDGWTLEGVGVTAGTGIRVTGSRNRIRGCRSYRNRATGIEISAADPVAPPEAWPSGNAVEDCISFENCDGTGKNADGFACKVAAGEGNSFTRCTAFLNTDDGFDLFSKNRPIGAVSIRVCESFLNGYLPDGKGGLRESAGNGNGFKLGGSGLAIGHTATGCVSAGNRRFGFTSNSNPYLFLTDCRSENNGGANVAFYYSGSVIRPKKKIFGHTEKTDPDFDVLRFWKTLQESRKDVFCTE